MTMIIAISNYLITYNKINGELKDFIDDFYDEAKLINEAKCYLLNNGKLDNYLLSNNEVSVEKIDNKYLLSYNDCSYLLSIEDKMIIDYSIE